MKRIVLFGWLLGGWMCGWAGGLVVASGENFGMDSLDSDEIRSVYTARQFRLGNKKVILLNLGAENPLRLRFEQNVLHENRDTLGYNWLQAHYLGHKVPTVFKSTESVAEFLSKVENSVGYLDEETAQKYRLKILFRVKE